MPRYGMEPEEKEQATVKTTFTNEKPDIANMFRAASSAELEALANMLDDEPVKKTKKQQS